MIPPLCPWLMAEFGLTFTQVGFTMTAVFVVSSIGQALAGVVVGCAARGAWPIAAPFVILWLAAPFVAQWVSRRPAVLCDPVPAHADVRALRSVARRTWRYFESFVGAGDHMLPPDNFQEDPNPTLAHRSSPTNFGLYLVSVVSARDFGWIGTADAIERLENTLATMTHHPADQPPARARVEPETGGAAHRLGPGLLATAELVPRSLIAIDVTDRPWVPTSCGAC